MHDFSGAWIRQVYIDKRRTLFIMAILIKC
jgi:hypothetical protein